MYIYKYSNEGEGEGEGEGRPLSTPLRVSFDPEYERMKEGSAFVNWHYGVRSSDFCDGRDEGIVAREYTEVERRERQREREREREREVGWGFGLNTCPPRLTGRDEKGEERRKKSYGARKTRREEGKEDEVKGK